MDVQTAERVELYAERTPPGDPIPINVQPSDVRDDTPDDAEIRAAVRKLRNGRAGGASNMRAEDIKSWLRGAEDEEKNNTEGAGDRWRAFVRLTQSIFEQGRVPRQMLWLIVVLIPKGNGDFRGIGLLEPFWKVLEIVMDIRLQAIPLHDSLHGFTSGRGTGTATMEVKLAQQLAYIEQEALYMVFIDLRKVYDAMDPGRCPKILEGYGVGPNI